jgi:hypothetical protein
MKKDNEFKNGDNIYFRYLNGKKHKGIFLSYYGTNHNYARIQIEGSDLVSVVGIDSIVIR